jgi:hypothetical protein
MKYNSASFFTPNKLMACRGGVLILVTAEKKVDNNSLT